MFIESDLLSTLVFILFLLLIYYIYSMKPDTNVWKNKKIKYKEPLPFFGNYAPYLLLQETYGKVTQDLYNEFKDEKFFGVFMSKNKSLVIRDPELIKHVISKDFHNFHSRGFIADAKKDPLNCNLFSTEGDMWKVLRQNLSPLFSSLKMKNMFYLVEQSAQKLEAFIELRLKKTDEFDIRDTMSRYTMDVIASCAFGLEINALDDSVESEFRRIGLHIFQASVQKRVKRFMRMFATRLYYLLKLNQNEHMYSKFFTNVLRETTKLREESGVTRHDFVDLMKSLRDRGFIEGDGIHSMKSETKEKVKIELSDELLAAQSFIFFSAGYETSATTMSFALFEIAKNEDIQNKLQVEINEVASRNNGMITYESLTELRILDMVIDETLRKYPVLENLTRKTMSAYRIPDTDIVLDAGTNIFIPLRALHRDPQYYPDPDKFDPYRFTPEMKAKRNPYVYMPFGEGPRFCIGSRFARMQAMLGIITVLKNYRVEPTTKTVKNITLDPRTFVTNPRDKIWLRLKPRIA